MSLSRLFKAPSDFTDVSDIHLMVMLRTATADGHSSRMKSRAIKTLYTAKCKSSVEAAINDLREWGLLITSKYSADTFPHYTWLGLTDAGDDFVRKLCEFAKTHPPETIHKPAA